MRLDLTITNPGAETGDTTGWTNELGWLGIRTANPSPHTGSYYFYGGNQSTMRAAQEIDLVSQGVSADTIDSGILFIEYAAYCSSYAGSDKGQLQVRFKDSTKTEISTISNSLYAPRAKEWVQRKVAGAVPANTRYVDIVMYAQRGAGTNNDAYFDDLSCAVIDNYRTPRYSVEFCDEPDSSPADGWTLCWSTSSVSTRISGGEFCLDLYTSGSLWGAACDAVGDVLDGDLCVNTCAINGGFTRHGLICRVSGTAGAENGYILSITDASDALVLERVVNGVITELASAAFIVSEDKCYFIRSRFTGDKFLGKIWSAALPEPDTWQIEYTDSSPYLTPGGVGIVSTGVDMYCVNFSYNSLSLAPVSIHTRRPIHHNLLVR